MRIAMLTGASKGLGQEFATRIANAFPEVEEIWLIARSADRLEAMRKELPLPSRAIAMDLTSAKDTDALSALLKSEKPDVRLLINNAGLGYREAFDESDPAELERMIRLDILALTLLTRAVLPYMKPGARILNVSSIASFVPNAYMTVYSASKAYVFSFSRSLGLELKARQIGVTALCPGPMATDFLETGRITGKSAAFRVLPYCEIGRTAEKGLLACKRGKPVYTPKAIYKLYRVVARLLPTRWFMRIAKT